MEHQSEARTHGNSDPALNHKDCDKKLTALSAMDREGIIKEWRAVFGHPAPRSAQVNLLRGALATRYQQDADEQGMHKQLSRQLRYWTAHAPVVSLKPGSKLFREWKGEVHQITVLDKGFEYAGQTYRSLTAITRQITKMGWSGPQFFGLRK